MVKYAMKFGIAETARQFNSTGVSVRKWVNRFDGSLDSLEDESKAPKRIPHKLTEEQEQELLGYRRRFPRWGPDRLKAQFNLLYSTRTIARVPTSRDGLTNNRKKKYKQKRDLRETKKKLKPFEIIQVDVKYLDDIEEFYQDWRLLHLPRYEFTARDVRTGMTFFSYGYEKSNLNASYFVEYVLLHLKRFGFSCGEITIQTDNGSEFVSPPNSKKKSMFEKTMESFGAKFSKFHRLPPHSTAMWKHFIASSKTNFIPLKDLPVEKNSLPKHFAIKYISIC